MIETRFIRLPPLSLAARSPDGTTQVAIMLPAATLEIDAVIRVLNEIEESHALEVAEHATWMGRRWPDDLALEQRVRSRELWRIGSYISFATTLERIIRASYEHLLGILRPCDRVVAAATEARHGPLRDARAAEVADIKLVRDKVFAHTSWSWPLGDSLSRQGTSLLYLSGNGATHGREGLLVGVAAVSVNGDDYGRLPIMNVTRLARTTADHLREWYAMFQDALLTLRALPDSAVLSGHPTVVSVVRGTDEP